MCQITFIFAAVVLFGVAGADSVVGCYYGLSGSTDITKAMDSAFIGMQVLMNLFSLATYLAAYLVFR